MSKFQYKHQCYTSKDIEIFQQLVVAITKELTTKDLEKDSEDLYEKVLED